jgi:hypothetical protein
MKTLSEREQFEVLWLERRLFYITGIDVDFVKLKDVNSTKKLIRNLKCLDKNYIEDKNED